MRLKIDINSDLGESFGHFRIGYDKEIMPFITSANIACGFHAGDPDVMALTVKLAKKNGVAVGAHPGFPDLIGFGRRKMSLSPKEVRNMITYQLGSLEAFARDAEIPMQHVKPHGALYNMAMNDEYYAEAIIEALQSFNPELVLFTLANSKIVEIASESGIRVACEAFIDRAYHSDGGLLPRNREGAVIVDLKYVVERAVKIVVEREITTIDGKRLKFDRVDTLCVHGDTLNAVEIAKSLRRELSVADVEVVSVGTFV